MTEPIVIELKDGPDFVLRRISYGAWQAIVAFSLTSDNAAGDHQIEVSQQTIDDTHYSSIGIIPLEPDPVAAAVQAERKRLLQVVKEQCGDQEEVLVRAALDAPDKQVSEYRQGAEDIERQVFEFLDETIKSYDPNIHSLARWALTAFGNRLRREWFMEPTDA